MASVPSRPRNERRRRAQLGRYAVVPDPVRRRLTLVTLLVSLLLWVVVILAVAVTSYRTGVLPGTTVHRTGTVQVTGACQPPGDGLVVRAWTCPAEVTAWGPALTTDLALSEATEVTVVSRTPLAGTVPVASRERVLGVYGYPYRENVSQEVVVPVDQAPLPDAVKLAVLLPLLAFPVLAFGLLLRLALRLVLPHHERAAGRDLRQRDGRG